MKLEVLPQMFAVCKVADYILTRAADLDRALAALRAAGHDIAAWRACAVERVAARLRRGGAAC